VPVAVLRALRRRTPEVAAMNPERAAPEISAPSSSGSRVDGFSAKRKKPRSATWVNAPSAASMLAKAVCASPGVPSTASRFAPTW
jgi:hypothetical protein